MSLTAAPYSSLSELPVLPALTSLSPAKRRTLAAASALEQLQALPLQLDLLVDPSPSSNPYFGILITHVTPRSSVWYSGIREGDVLLSLNAVRTVGLDDLRVALEGCIPGDEVAVVVERAGEEREVRVMLGARDVSDDDVRALYGQLMEEIAAHGALRALADASSSPLSTPLTPSTLTLSDLLDTPQFAHSLLSYMDSALCSECLHFLIAHAAFQRIPPSEPHRLSQAARAICDTFIADDAAQLVNIDSLSRRAVQHAVHNGDFSSTLFLNAAKEVYQLTEARRAAAVLPVVGLRRAGGARRVEGAERRSHRKREEEEPVVLVRGHGGAARGAGGHALGVSGRG